MRRTANPQLVEIHLQARLDDPEIAQSSVPATVMVIGYAIEYMTCRCDRDGDAGAARERFGGGPHSVERRSCGQDLQAALRGRSGPGRLRVRGHGQGAGSPRRGDRGQKAAARQRASIRASPPTTCDIFIFLAFSTGCWLHSPPLPSQMREGEAVVRLGCRFMPAATRARMAGLVTAEEGAPWLRLLRTHRNGWC